MKHKMVIKKKYTLITTYRQDKEKINSVVNQNFLLRKTILKQVVVRSKINIKITGQPKIC